MIRLLFSLLLFSMACGAQVWLAPKQKLSTRKICALHVMPAQFTVAKGGGFRGTGGLWEKNDELEDELPDLVAKILAGLALRVTVAGPKADLDEDQRNTLAVTQRQYDALEARMMRSLGGVKKGRYTLGNPPDGYGPANKADALLFIRGKGAVRAIYAGLSGSAGLVDARTGEVLALLLFECTAGHGKDTSPAKALSIHFTEILRESEPLQTFLASGRAGGCRR